MSVRCGCYRAGGGFRGWVLSSYSDQCKQLHDGMKTFTISLLTMYALQYPMITLVNSVESLTALCVAWHWLCVGDRSLAHRQFHEIMLPETSSEPFSGRNWVKTYEQLLRIRLRTKTMKLKWPICYLLLVCIHWNICIIRFRLWSIGSHHALAIT